MSLKVSSDWLVSLEKFEQIIQICNSTEFTTFRFWKCPGDHLLPLEEKPWGPILDNLPREKVCLSGPVVHGCQSRSSKHYSFSLSSCFSADWSIEALLHKWNLKCLNIPQEKFHANKDQLAGSTLPGSHTVQMIITEDKESWMKDNCQLILQLLLARHIQSHQIVMTQYKINGSKQFKLYSISVLLKFYNK